MSWKLKELAKKKLSDEIGAIITPLGQKPYRFGFVYPNYYYIGMSNLGFQILYSIINQNPYFACERAFLPEKKEEQEYIRTNTPLFTLENQVPLYQMDLVGFSISFEMDYFNFLHCLELSRIPQKASERSDSDPLIIVGGPCATFNPEPIADFVDIFVIGEGEITVQRILEIYHRGRDAGQGREDLLSAMADIPGVYIPSFYQPVYDETGLPQAMQVKENKPTVIERQWVQELDEYKAETQIITPDTEFGKLYLIEVARGCGRHCRFCMAGYCFRQPRIHSLEKVKEAVLCAKRKMSKVGLMGAAISDYPWIDELSAFIRENDMEMSVASLRADSLTEPLAQALADSGQKTITIAPEAGSSAMRQTINKGIEEDDIYRAIDLAIEKGIKNVKLYIMIGLPGETNEDIDAIVVLAKDIYQYVQQKGGKGLLTLSVNPFIPKPFTPFQWLPMEQKKSIEEKLKYIQKNLRAERKIQVFVESPKEAYIQGVLARGDRRLCEVLSLAMENGGSKAFFRAMKDCGLKEDFYLYRLRDREELFPWSHLDMKIKTDYLWQELQNAYEKKFTKPCFRECRRCGVCQ